MFVTLKGRKIDLSIWLSRLLTACALLAAGGQGLGVFHIPATIIDVCGTVIAVYNFCAQSGLAPSGLVRPVK